MDTIEVTRQMPRIEIHMHELMQQDRQDRSHKPLSRREPTIRQAAHAVIRIGHRFEVEDARAQEYVLRVRLMRSLDRAVLA